MNPLPCSHKTLAACAALSIAAGLAVPAHAVDRNWTCPGGTWSVNGCWNPFGRPLPVDVARIGNVAGVANQTVLLDVTDPIAGLHLTNGMVLDTNGRAMDVNGPLTVSGRNIVGATEYFSTVVVRNAVAGPDLTVDSFALSSLGRISMAQGTLRVEGVANIGVNGRILDNGTIQLAGAGTTLINSGAIQPGTGGLYLVQVGNGLYDADGPGDGVLDLTTPGGAILSFQGSSLADDFSGIISMAPDALLQMDLSNGWECDALSRIWVYDGAGAGLPSRIIGDPLSFFGSMNLFGSSHLRVESGVTLQPGSEVHLGISAHAEFDGPTTVNDGTFTISEDGDLDFDGPTTLHGGTFSSFSNFFIDGYTSFNGATTWAGDVVINGVARQLGPVSVAAPSTITADVFDMDGNGTTLWTVSAPIEINADSIAVGSTGFDGTLNISGPISGSHLTINLSDVADEWYMSGVMNLTGNILFSTRLRGSPVAVSGALNVPSGRVNIASDVRLMNSADVSINGASSVLRFLGESSIAGSTTFTGTGMIQNGPDGHMTIDGAADTATVGLMNQGVLDIDSDTGLVRVDRFENTAGATFRVQIGGYVAGAEFDRLHVTGGAPATLSGTIEVAVIDKDGDGTAFRPALGDSFAVITTAGGVNGAFQPTAVSMVDGYTYEWTVISNPSSVVLRLDHIIAPCRADFNHNGAVTVQDVFDFLVAWFALDLRADMNGSGSVTLQDVFDYLAAFFAGCA